MLLALAVLSATILSSMLAPTRIIPILFLCLPVCQLLCHIVQQLGGIATAAVAKAICQQDTVRFVRTAIGHGRRIAIGQRLVAVLQAIRMPVAERRIAIAIGLGRRRRRRLGRRLWHEQIVVGIDALAVAIWLGVSVGQQRVLLLQMCV